MLIFALREKIETSVLTDTEVQVVNIPRAPSGTHQGLPQILADLEADLWPLPRFVLPGLFGATIYSRGRLCIKGVVG